MQRLPPQYYVRQARESSCCRFVLDDVDSKQVNEFLRFNDISWLRCSSHKLWQTTLTKEGLESCNLARRAR